MPGMQTAAHMLDNWEDAAISEEEDEPEGEGPGGEGEPQPEGQPSRVLTGSERSLLEQFLAALEANQERDPKYAVVVHCLKTWNWLEAGCIVFSQYRELDPMAGSRAD